MPDLVRYLVIRISQLYSGPPLSVSEIAKLIEVPRTSLWTWCDNGRPPLFVWVRLIRVAFARRLELKNLRRGCNREFRVIK
jgi:hypothetical protein